VKFKSAFITQGSGSTGGLTVSHNRGGLYTRARSIPTNPNSVYQQAVRGYLATLTSLWNNVLDADQRSGWDTYAENVKMPDRLGEPRNIGGLGHYVRSNVARLQAALDRVDDPPTVFNLGEFTNPAFGTFAAATQDFAVTFDNEDEWANEDGSAALLLGSRSANASVNYFKGPYRFAGAILGAAVAPPDSPATIDNPFPVVVGNLTFVQWRVSRADGRLSLPFRGFGLGA
jgi:hypothetical protein